MSIEAVAWVLKQQIAKHTAKLVLIALANHHNESTNECFPSKQKLMEAACCCEKTAERCLRWLEANGWIKRVPGYTEKGRRTTNTYVINRDRSNGGQVDPLPQLVRGPSRRRAVPVKLTPITSLNRKSEPKNANARISKSLQEAEERQPPAEPPPPEQRKKVGGLVKDLAASLRMSQASHQPSKRRRSG